MQSFKIRLRRARFWWSLLEAYVSRYRIWAFSLIITISIVGFGVFRIWPLISKNNQISIGYVGNYTLETIPTQVLSLVTQSLITTDKSGKPQASLASHWAVSDDGKTYVVFLKDNLTWHDSTTLNAKDLSIAISDVKITALNNKAIEFKLPNPIASFPEALDKPVFKSKSFYGTGKFRIVKIDKIGDFVKRISLIPEDKDLPRVDIKFYQNEDQAQKALTLGEVKAVSIGNAKMFEKWPNLDVSKKVGEDEIVTVFYNTQDPLLTKDVRQALTYAINKSDFDGQAAVSPISPGSWAASTNTKKYEYNTGKAKELLSRSQVENPTITLSYMPDLKSVAESIKRDWEAADLKTELMEVPTIPGKFQALLAVNKLSPDPDQYALWHSSQRKTNITGFSDVKIDKLLEDARTTRDENKRKEFYADFQRFLTEDAPASFLYHPFKYTVTYKNAKRLLEKLPKSAS